MAKFFLVLLILFPLLVKSDLTVFSIAMNDYCRTMKCDVVNVSKVFTLNSVVYSSFINPIQNSSIPAVDPYIYNHARSIITSVSVGNYTFKKLFGIIYPKDIKYWNPTYTMK